MVTKQEFPGRIEYRNEKGQLHSLDGPAIEFKDGTKIWCINGFNHREDGPAIEYPDGSKSWYLNGTFYSEQEWSDKIIKIKLDRLKIYGN